MVREGKSVRLNLDWNIKYELGPRGDAVSTYFTFLTVPYTPRTWCAACRVVGEAVYASDLLARDSVVPICRGVLIDLRDRL